MTATSLRRALHRPAGHPLMHTTYGQDRALLTRPRSWLAAAAGIGVVAWVPMMVDDDILIILGTGLVLAVGAIGLNLVMGYAGQVSLAHAFFVGIGAYTAAALSGDPEGRYIGLRVEFAPVWIIASGIVAGLCGAAVAPLASRLRGLYLAIVTLGLVFIGVYVFRSWTSLSGGINVGRDAAEPALLGEPLTVDGAFTAEQKLYWLFLAVLAISVLTAANIARSRIGRAFAAVRDRDIAAEVMGIPVPRYKTLAFALSAVYAGVGSLLFAAHGHFSPEQFGLAMSIQFIAIVLIGGGGDNLRDRHGCDVNCSPSATHERTPGVDRIHFRFADRASQRLRSRADSLRGLNHWLPAFRASGTTRHLAANRRLLAELSFLNRPRPVTSQPPRRTRCP